jgi:hypothetical protein
MIERLKSLPLTIVLTILIWMYAEAQFASTQDNVRVTLKVVSPTPEYVITAENPDGRYRNSVSITVSVQGAKNQIDRLYQMSLNAITPDKDFQDLFFSPDERKIKTDPDPSEDTVRLLNGLRYFRDRGMTVTLATPARIRLRVEKPVPATPPEQINPAASTGAGK